MTKQLPRLIVDVVVVILAVMGALLCVTTAFDLSVDVFVLLAVTAISAMVFTTCFLWKKALWALLPLCVAAVLLGTFTGLFSSLGPALQQLAHDILTRFSSAYRNLSFIIPSEPEIPVQSYTLLFSVLAVLLTVWMAWGVGYRSCLISVAGTLPFLLLCVIINDTPPHAVPLVMLFTAWMTVLLAKERPDEPPSMDALRMGLTLAAVLLLLTVVGTVYPKEDTRDKELPELIQSILDQLPGPVQNVLSRDSTGVEDEDLGADTSEILDLTTQGTRNRKDTVMMQLSSTETGVLYLRGAAKDIYTGTSWESRNAASSAQSVYAHTSLGTAFGSTSQAAMEIRNYYDNATVAFIPYGFISCTGAGEIVTDLRVPCTQDDYVIYFWPGVDTLDLTADYDAVNESYDSYVAETCLELPEGTRETLYELALSYGYDPSLSDLETVAWVAEFVRSVGSYQLEVSRQPANFDFAVYFLTESQKGYCVHFATAAAAMLRALGIPSRYASGYRVTVTEAGAVTDVTDKDTHAWAEFYISGLGWLPLETTPGFGSSVALPEVAHEPQQTEAPSPSPEEATAEPEEPSPSPSEEPSPSPSEEPAAPSEDQEGASPSMVPSAPVSGGSAGGNWLLLLWIPVLLAVVVCVLALRRTLVRNRREKQFHTGNRNQAVIAQWAYLERLAPWGAELPKDLEALALKAKFSQHEITQEELTACSQATIALEARTQKSLTRWRRFRYRWFSCMDLKK